MDGAELGLLLVPAWLLGLNLYTQTSPPPFWALLLSLVQPGSRNPFSKGFGGTGVLPKPMHVP